MARASSLPLVLLLCGSPLTAQSVFVVDDDAGPTVDFTDLQKAIDAALPGDTLLVQSGTYGREFGDGLLVSTPLRILAAPGASVVLEESLCVEDVNTGSVTLSGLNLVVPELADPRAFVFTNSSAPIWVEDCHNNAASSEGLRANGADQVIAIRSSFAGNTTSPLSSSRGIWATDSTLHLFDCTVTGGGAGPSGAPGVYLVNGELFASGSTIQGGTNESAFFLCSGDGGSGLEVFGLTAVARLLDTELLGGSPGDPPPGCQQAGDGEPFVLLSGGTVTTVPGVARHYSAEPVVFAGTASHHQWSGEVGDTALLALGGEPASTTLANVTGTLLLGGPIAIVSFGTLASGTLDVDLATPFLGALPQYLLYLQGAFLSGFEAYLGSATAQTILP